MKLNQHIVAGSKSTAIRTLRVGDIVIGTGALETEGHKLVLSAFNKHFTFLVLDTGRISWAFASFATTANYRVTSTEKGELSVTINIGKRRGGSE